MNIEPSRNMFVRIAQRAASIGWCYDLSQFLAGAPIVRRHLRESFRYCTTGSRVLDIGGGTGAVAKLIPAGCHYTCLDNELPKLKRCQKNVSVAGLLLADAVHLPVRESSVDMVTCIFVVHHLTDAQVGKVL